MKRISIKEFAEQAMKLTPGATIRFSVTDEDWKTLEYVISLVRVADACCLLASCAGGGRPLVIDVTIYDSSLLNICETLDKYINGGTGNYGYVDVIESVQDTAGKSGNLPTARMSVHLEKHRLQDTACRYLSDLAGREITAYYDRRDYYHWGFNIADTPLSKEEIEKLFLTAGADDFDRDSNDFGDYPIMEINQGLAEKMLAGELPFTMFSSHADDEGVWFFGPPEAQQVNILVTYPETDMEPDIIRFSLKEGVSENDLTNCFWDTLEEVENEAGADERDRLSMLDAVIERVTGKTGCKAAGLPITLFAGIISKDIQP